MPTLEDEYEKNAIRLGNHVVSGIVKLHGIENLPNGIGMPAWFGGNTVLSLKLPSVAIPDSSPDSMEWEPRNKILLRRREFYLCYSPKHKFLFVVETEMRRHQETDYRAQYGANDNYDTSEVTQRIVWIYSVDSPRAREPLIAGYLKQYLA